MKGFFGMNGNSGNFRSRGRKVGGTQNGGFGSNSFFGSGRRQNQKSRKLPFLVVEVPCSLE